MLIGILTGAIAGLLANVLIGKAAWLTWVTENLAMPVGQIFLRALFMLVVPLLFAALVVGIAGLELRELGRLGVKTLIYTVSVSFIAVVIGLALVNTLRPGEGAGSELLRSMVREGGSAIPPAPAPPQGTAAGLIVSMVPDNPIKAAATGDMIGVIVFALVFGIALAVTRTEAAGKLRDMIQGLYDVMMTCIEGVLRLAPYGVGALLFVMAVRMGTDLLGALAAYVGVAVLGLALHMFVVYSLLLRIVGRRSPLWFFRGARLAMATAFSTASSSATLPTALKVAEETLGLPKSVSRFVLTVGATMNQNGTALFEGVTVLFLAQLYGVHLSLGQQALVMLISVLAGIGTAGVPAGSLPVVAMILAMFKIPPEGLGLILGVDRFLDMCRTTLNVTGDLVAAVCLSPQDGRDGEEAPAPAAATKVDAAV
jgi:dicarboxylate/amino acid:cation (Na+ or H+) symporter, DAACS family